MNTIGKLSLVATVAALAFGPVSAVKANEFGVDGTAGALDFTTPTTFSLTDSLFDVSGLTSEGTLTLTGDFAATSPSTFNITNVNATEDGFNLITGGTGFLDEYPSASSVFLLTTDPNSYKLGLTSTDVSMTPSGFAFPQIGGSYTGSPAPEVSSSVALGAMLIAGGLLFFSAKRKASSPTA